jgi:hypothetical protein
MSSMPPSAVVIPASGPNVIPDGSFVNWLQYGSHGLSMQAADAPSPCVFRLPPEILFVDVCVPMQSPHVPPLHVRVPSEHVTYVPEVCSTFPQATVWPGALHEQPRFGVEHDAVDPPPGFPTESFSSGWEDPQPVDAMRRVDAKAKRKATETRTVINL